MARRSSPSPRRRAAAGGRGGVRLEGRDMAMQIVITLAETGGAQSYVRDLLPALVDRFDVVVGSTAGGVLQTSQRVGLAIVGNWLALRTSGARGRGRGESAR